MHQILFMNTLQKSPIDTGNCALSTKKKKKCNDLYGLYDPVYTKGTYNCGTRTRTVGPPAGLQ